MNTEQTATPRLRVVAQDDAPALHASASAPEGGRGAATAAPVVDREQSVFPEKIPEKTSAKIGRPKGSRNKVSADARALLASHGLAGLRALCAVAAGKAIYRPLKNGKGREKIIPELDQMLVAQRAILDRLVPALRATEMSGKDGSALFPSSPAQDSRQTARAVLALFGDAAAARLTDENDSEDETGAATSSGTICSDSDTLAASPSPAVALTGESEVWAPADSPTSSHDKTNFPAGGKSSPEIGKPLPIGNTGAFIELVTIAGDGRESWGVFAATGQKWATERTKEAADAKARELVEARKI